MANATLVLQRFLGRDSLQQLAGPVLILLILRRLRDTDGFIEFVAMFDPSLGAPVLVVHFLAMLELAREQLLEITQTEAFAPIYVRLANGRVEP